jgi:hypothetical protein
LIARPVSAAFLEISLVVVPSAARVHGEVAISTPIAIAITFIALSSIFAWRV